MSIYIYIHRKSSLMYVFVRFVEDRYNVVKMSAHMFTV